MKIWKKILTSVFVCVLVISMLAGLSFSGIGNVDEECIVLIRDAGSIGDIEELKGSGEIVDRYGDYVLLESSKDALSRLEEAGYEIDRLKDRNELEIKGHEFNPSEGSLDMEPELTLEGYEEDKEGLYIVDMFGPVNPSWREELEKAGVEVINYVPNYAYEVKMSPDQVEDIEEKFFVDHVEVYQPAFKLAEDLRPGMVSVSMVDGSRSIKEVRDESRLVELAQRPDVYYINNYEQPGLQGEIATQMIGGGAWIEDPEDDPDNPYRLDNGEPPYGGDAGSIINQIGYTGEGVTIAVADSGIGDGTPGDSGVEDFTGRVVGGYSFLDDDWGDDNTPGHGTFCASMAAGDGYHGTEIQASDRDWAEQLGDYYLGQGSAPESELFAVKALDSRGGWSGPSDTFEVVEVASQNSESYIHSNSWGARTSYGGYPEESSSFDEAVRDSNRDTEHNEPMVVTVAVGNDGPDFNNVEPPSTGKNVIGVGSNENYMPEGDVGVTPCDNPENVSEFSSRGWTDDGRVKPDVVAPGENVFMHASPIDDNTYYVQQGTSFANPAVAGAAAIGVEWFEDEHGYRPSPAMVKSMLINTAYHLNEDEGNTGPIPNRMEGWGMVHIPDLIDSDLEFEFKDQERTLTTGETDEYDIEVGDLSEPLKVTLTWTDKEAEPGDSITLKNDLNLELISPSGETYRGNAFPTDQDGFSTSNHVEAGAPAMETFDGSGDGWDDRNNVQNVYIHPDDLEEGTYSINVIGEDIPEDANNDGEASQDYALVMNNVLDEETPSIELERPVGGEEWTEGNKEDIEWSTEEGDAPISGIDLEYSTDGGVSWIDIETGMADTGTYGWAIPHESTEEALVRATVHDDNDLSDTDVSDRFTIMGEPPEPPADLQVEHYSLESGVIYEDDVSEDKGYTTEIWSSDDNTLVEGTSIAVVDEDNVQGDAIVDRLSDLPYTFTVLESDELIGEMSNHDHFLVQRFGSDDIAEDFLDELEDGQGVVYLDSGYADDDGQYQEYYGDGVFRSHNIRNDPEERGEVSIDYEGLELEIDEQYGDHPIFDGVGDGGDVIDMFTDHIRGSYFHSYSCSTLGQVNYIDSNTGGDGVGVSDDGTEVLLPALNIGYQADAEHDGWTEEAGRLLANSVEFVVEMSETESEWGIREHGSTMGESSWDFGDMEYIKAGQAYESRLISPEIDIPEDAQDVKLYFDQWYELDDDHDGSNLKVSTDGIEGGFTLIEPEEGYDGTVSGTNNPLEGEQGWSGQADWKGVTFDLTAYVGESIHLRWNAGIDEEEMEGKGGWRIDDISIIDEGDEGDEDNLLTWEASLDDPDTVEEYNIYRSEDAGGPYEEIVTLNAEGFDEYDYIDEGKGTGDDVLWWYKVTSGDTFGREISTDPVREPGDELEVVITRPEGGEIWFIGEEEEIRWSSAPGDHDIESVDLEYTIDGGVWETIVEGSDDTGSFDWVVVDEITEDAQIRVTAHDEGGGSDSDTSGSFTITESRILEIDVEGEGSTDPPEGIHHYELDEDVVVKAIPDVGHYFEEWTGDYTGTEEEITVTMDEDKDITAWFEAHKYELDVTTVGEGDVEIDPDQESYHHGTEVTLTAIPEEDWHFEEWTGDHTGAQEEVTITMDDDKELTAHFDEADPAHFDVEINSPDEGDNFYEGETIRVEYHVENIGDLEDTQDVTFLIEGAEQDVLTELTLDGGEVYTDDFTWEVDALGDHELEVMSEDTDDTVTIFVEERPDDPYFSVNILDHDDEVTVGEEVTVDYRVINVGEQEGTQDIVISVDDQEVERREGIDLGMDEEYDDEVTIQMGDEGEYEVEVASEDDKDSVSVSVVVPRYGLDIEIRGEGEIDIDPERDEYEEGTEVTLTASPDENWYFVEWTGDHESTEAEIFIVMDEDKKITAWFEEEQVETYELKINIEGEGSTDPEKGPHTFEENEEVTVTATPDEGWYFVEWTGIHEGTEEEITIMMDEDKEITAEFEEHEVEVPLFEITDIDVSGEEVDVGDEVKIELTLYNPGDDTETQTVELEINPELSREVTLDAGSETSETFTWKAEEEGDYEIRIYVEEEYVEEVDGEPIEDVVPTITVEEDPGVHTLTIDLEGEGTTDPSPGSHIFEEGSDVNITATPDEGWYFVEWIGDVLEEEEEITVTMEGEKEVTAVFEEEVEPAHLEVEIIDYDEGIREGEDVTIRFRVTNTGGVEESRFITLYSDGEQLEVYGEVELGPGEEYEGEFILELEEVGEHEFAVDSNDSQESININVMGDDTEDDDGTFVSEYWWLIGVLLIGVIGIVAIIFVVQNRESEEGNELKEETGCQDDESSENHQRTSSSQNN